MLHMHNGDIVTLVDIDDNPDTITFETDKFSQFALAYDDKIKAETNNLESSAVFDRDNKMAYITSDQTVKGAAVIFAAYSEGQLASLQIKTVDLAEGENDPITADDLDTTNADDVKLMVWRDLKTI